MRIFLIGANLAFFGFLVWVLARVFLLNRLVPLYDPGYRHEWSVAFLAGKRFISGNLWALFWVGLAMTGANVYWLARKS